MKKKFLSILTVLLMTTMLTSTVSAGGNVKLTNVQFSLGSLIAQGFATGVGKTDVTFVLDAVGIPAITCINNGSNSVPGQSSPKISATGRQNVLGSDPRIKNGRTPFRTETDDPDTLAWDLAGCPNSNWIGHVDFIFWTDATISIYSTATNQLLTKQDYTCTTTRNPDSVICTLVQ